MFECKPSRDIKKEPTESLLVEVARCKLAKRHVYNMLMLYKNKRNKSDWVLIYKKWMRALKKIDKILNEELKTRDMWVTPTNMEW